MIIVVRVVGQVKNRRKDNETLKRLNLLRKFNAVVVDEEDKVRMGMIGAVSHMVAFGSVTDEFIGKLKGRLKDGVYRLHPPRGGFKKSSKVAFPKGILGRHGDISKLVGRMI